MTIRFLGAGGAFSPEFGSSAAVIPSGENELLLVDCGATTFLDLKNHDLLPGVTSAVITHLHDDHVGSLGSLIFYSYYVLERRLTLAVPPRLVPLIRSLLGLQITHGSFEKFVRIQELKPVDTVGALSVRFIDTFGRHQVQMPTFGYVFTNQSRTIVYSGDMGDPDFIFSDIAGCDPAATTVFHDVCFERLPSQAHAFYKDLERHLDAWTIYGYHNNPLQAPEDLKMPLVYHHEFGELIGADSRKS